MANRSPSDSRGRGRPKDPDKREAILQAATRLFTAQGLSGTSMEAVAAEAGVSKITVYSHFQSKDALFQETVMAKCGQHWPADVFDASANLPTAVRLRRIGIGFLDLVNSREVLSIYRLLIAQAGRPTRFGRLFWEAGPDRTMQLLAGVLEAAQAAGEIRVADPRAAASHFFALLKGEHHIRCLIGAQPVLDAAGRRRHVESVVRLFLRAHRPGD